MASVSRLAFAPRLLLPTARSLCYAANRINFAYLNLRGHPRGNRILQSLVHSGFVPEVVVEEDSSMASRDSALLDSELVKLDLSRYSMAPGAEEILKGANVGHFLVHNHNDEQCVEILKRHEVDAIVLGDCRILKPHFLAEAPSVVINTHPGYLPYVRGNHCSMYAIIHDLPIGCSSHLVDTGVDTGPIIDRTLLELDWTNTRIEELLWHLNEACANLAVGAVDALQQGKLRTKHQEAKPIHPFGTFTAIDPALKELAITKLHSGGYHGGSLEPKHGCGIDEHHHAL